MFNRAKEVSFCVFQNSPRCCLPKRQDMMFKVVQSSSTSHSACAVEQRRLCLDLKSAKLIFIVFFRGIDKCEIVSIKLTRRILWLNHFNTIPAATRDIPRREKKREICTRNRGFLWLSQLGSNCSISVCLFPSVAKVELKNIFK